MPLRIVIADDHAVVRRGVRALLESQPGWEVAGEATTGREAVELAKRLQPDIVVLDLSMPELNGLEATRQIVKESPRSEVLVLTMHHSEELTRNVLQAGARATASRSCGAGVSRSFSHAARSRGAAWRPNPIAVWPTASSRE
jgi:DNA-binding NarL/FixJ family response regulator